MKTFHYALIAILIFPLVASAQYAIDWYTIDGGGGYTLKGGFWHGVIVPSTAEAPVIFIPLSGTSTIISWSPGTPGFALEETDSLSSPSWSSGLAGNPTPPFPAGTGTKFYRSRKP